VLEHCRSWERLLSRPGGIVRASQRLTMRHIDLNADVGEGDAATDAALLPLMTSANVACGLHAGDARSMRATVALAQRHGVAVGAHPGYDDRQGFGRRPVHWDPDALPDLLLRQLGRPDPMAGSVLPGSEAGAVLTDAEDVARQVRSLVTDGEVVASDGSHVPVTFETLCLHGDTPGSSVLAARIRRELHVLGVSVSAPHSPGAG